MARNLRKRYPILEYDNDAKAIIDPSIAKKGLKKRAPVCLVMCFFQEVLRKLEKRRKIRRIFDLRSEIGANPVFALRHAGKILAVVHPGLGGPLAGGFLDEMIALGARKIVVAGGAGVLDGSIAKGEVIVPRSAVRDEGTSYHYLRAGREVAPGSRALASIKRVLGEIGMPYRCGKTWTTDALYRETKRKVAMRRKEGCVSVEMEAASMFAVARFRRAELGLILYGGDDVSGKVWDHRGWDKHISMREQLFWIAVEACAGM